MQPKTKPYSSLSLKLALATLLIFIGMLATSYQVNDVTIWTGYGLVVGAWLFSGRKFIKGDKFRIFIIMLLSFVSFRYFAWRATSTLVFTGPIDFIFVALLFLAELEVTLVHFVGVFSNIFPMKHRKPPHLPLDLSKYPTVDVYIPTYNEPEEVAEITALACLDLDYPKEKINVYILDDGGTKAKRENPQSSADAWFRHRRLKQFAKKNGCFYITRDENTHAKSGNINHALTQTNGELILCLDCDHVPAREFLKHTVGWFLKDPKLFLVQTPHFFVNPDPLEQSMHTFAKVPSENEMFFRSTLPGMDLWNAAFFCGSAAVLRRSALEEVGGIAGETVTEDAETALKLHAKGYNSIYYNKPMVCGMTPETISDFMLQRTRWCQGMIQMGILFNPFKQSGLTLAQKVCYSSFYLFWFFGLARLMFLIAPSLFLIFGMQVYHASVEQIMMYAVPHVIGSLLVSNIMYGRYRWPLFSELYESIQSIFLAPVVLGVIAEPRKPVFKVTPKGNKHGDDVLSPLAKPFYFICFVLLLSVPFSIYKWFEYPLMRDTTLVCFTWLSINIVLVFASFGVFWERHQVRNHHRALVNLTTGVSIDDKSKPIPGVIHDISISGTAISLKTEALFLQDQKIKLHFKDKVGRRYHLDAEVKRVQEGAGEITFGCQFTNVSENIAELVHLVYEDSDKWQEFWFRPLKQPNIARILSLFITCGKTGTVESLRGFKRYIFFKINERNKERSA
ncbi:UDP-forming cellulose synthase catalytic subunit [Pseudoalteromonas sp. G4]|uniref:UDP-forming cellulose synthase catalytic subunit n=1 Tax=Pseudoalteromonas sp. G4 TaxID=2992761 RepID=UPI00237DF45A|nr:UDP-forming cellulose synthase catalytic subunit [Pseudoalteromonas sp. G4]MDE3270403.1 UDP-forming cellulose synthase catalytic subunit [Pseudoalteromonas sp. G4]